jgi:hypothetical protein
LGIEMSKRAVLVGINYEDAPEDCPPLSGCVNDVWMLQELLIRRYGFIEEDITILIDADNDGSYQLPTGRNIMVSIATRIRSAKWALPNTYATHS